MATVENLLAKCVGTTIIIPFFFEVGPGWQCTHNPNFGQHVEDTVEEWRQKWVTNPACYAHSKRASTGYITSVTYPDAPLPELQTLGRFYTWLFAWDDLIDFGEFDNKYETRRSFLNETISFIQKGFSSKPIIDATSLPSRMAASIYGICVALNQGIRSASAKKAICTYLCEYVSAAIRLQNGFEEGEILDLDTYLDIRMDSSCVYPMLVFVCENDVASAPIEIKCKHVDNMIPILVHQGMSAQEAVDYAAQAIRQCRLDFERLELELLELGVKHRIEHEVEVFLKGIKKYYIGLVDWTYTTKRYFDYDPSWGSVGMAVVLGQPGKGIPVAAKM